MFKKWLENPTVAKLWQFVKFGIVGVSNTAISLCVYEICIHLGLHYVLSNGIGLVVSVINAYYWNNRCVFGDGEKKTFAYTRKIVMKDKRDRMKCCPRLLKELFGK